MTEKEFPYDTPFPPVKRHVVYHMGCMSKSKQSSGISHLLTSNRRFFVLNADRLWYVQNVESIKENSSSELSKFIGCIDMNGARIHCEISGRKIILSTYRSWSRGKLSHRRQFFLECESEGQFEGWQKALTKSISLCILQNDQKNGATKLCDCSSELMYDTLSLCKTSTLNWLVQGMPSLPDWENFYYRKVVRITGGHEKASKKLHSLTSHEWITSSHWRELYEELENKDKLERMQIHSDLGDWPGHKFPIFIKEKMSVIPSFWSMPLDFIQYAIDTSFSRTSGSIQACFSKLSQSMDSVRSASPLMFSSITNFLDCLEEFENLLCHADHLLPGFQTPRDLKSAYDSCLDMRDDGLRFGFKSIIQSVSDQKMYRSSKNAQQTSQIAAILAAQLAHSPVPEQSLSLSQSDEKHADGMHVPETSEDGIISIRRFRRSVIFASDFVDRGTPSLTVIEHVYKIAEFVCSIATENQEWIYTQRQQLMNKMNGTRALKTKFRGSKLKTKSDVQFLPTNAHIQSAKFLESSIRKKTQVQPVNVEKSLESAHADGSPVNLSRSEARGSAAPSAVIASGAHASSHQGRYSSVTCGAFAAHEMKFKHGGLVSELQKLHIITTTARNQISGIMESVGNVHQNVLQDMQTCLCEAIRCRFLFQRRLCICLSQGISVIADAALTALKTNKQNPKFWAALTNSGALPVLVNGYLSTYESEHGMIEDTFFTCWWIKQMGVQFRVEIAQDDAQAEYLKLRENQGIASGYDWTLKQQSTELPPLCRLEYQMAFNQNQNTGEQSSIIPTIVAIVSPRELDFANGQFPAARSMLEQGFVRLLPIFQNVGINEKQYLANKLNKQRLLRTHESVNHKAADVLRLYYRAVQGGKRVPISIDSFGTTDATESKGGSNGASHSQPAEISSHSTESSSSPACTNTKEILSQSVMQPANEDLVPLIPEHVEGLHFLAGSVHPSSNTVHSEEGLANDFACMIDNPEAAVTMLEQIADASVDLGFGHVIMCKSGKDRTSMAVTYEQCRFARRHHSLQEEQVWPLLNAMRIRGTRIMNVKKNTGHMHYAFNEIQVKFLPEWYRPPPETRSWGTDT